MKLIRKYSFSVDWLQNNVEEKKLLISFPASNTIVQRHNNNNFECKLCWLNARMCKGLVVGCAFLLRIKFHPKISCKSFSVFFETPNLPQMLLHILKYLFAREFHKINSLHLSLKYFLLKYALATNSIHTLEKMILDIIPCGVLKAR